MEPALAIIAATVSGAFGVGGALLAWSLKSRSEEKERDRLRAKERLEELKSLYVSVFVSVEQAIRIVQARESFILDRDLSEVNGKVRLLASNSVAESYYEVAELLHKWSKLFELASPRRMKAGDDTVMLIQSPDPTAEFKQPAIDAHEELQDAIEKLIEVMRTEVRIDARSDACPPP